MELIATARFKKAMDRAVEADAFTRKIAELAADLAASATEIEHPLLSVTLAATRGNQIRAADLLGVNRNTLRKKIRDLDIQVFRSSG